MDLSEIRKDIDRIDGDLVPLLCERLDCSGQVATYKYEHGIPVLNEQREREVLEKIAARSAENDPNERGYGRANQLVYSTIMDVSRALQHRMLGAGGDLRKRLETADKALIPSERARVACQGARGAFSHEAAKALFPKADPSFLPTWEDVIRAVKNGEADYGLLPIENSSTGSVHEVYDLMIANRCHIAAAVDVPVKQCLLGVKGTTLADIRTVTSHPQALSQCREFIREHGWTEQSGDNTATAAQAVAQKGDRALAAIGSKEAANTYGLSVIAENIQTVCSNTTRFVAISQNLCIPADADRITLLFRLPHTTGSLYHTLGRFALEGLNLTKLESRPLKNGSFEYAFYLDFEGNAQNENTIALLCALNDELPQFTLLGNYHEQTLTE